MSGPLRSRFGRCLPGGADRFPPVWPPVREELPELEVEAKVAVRLFLPVRRGGSRAWEASGRAKEKGSPVGSSVSVPEPRAAGRRPRAAPAHNLESLLEDSKEKPRGLIGVFGVSWPKVTEPKVYNRPK